MARKASSKPDFGYSGTATTGFEVRNVRLKGVLPQDSVRLGSDNHPLGEWTNLIPTITLAGRKTGFQPVPSGYNELKTRSTSHRSVVLADLVEMPATYNGRIYGPACGTGGRLPASRLSGVRSAEKNRAIAQGGSSRNKAPLPPAA